MTAEENIFCSTTKEIKIKNKKCQVKGVMTILETFQRNYREVVAHFLAMCEIFHVFENVKGAR